MRYKKAVETTTEITMKKHYQTWGEFKKENLSPERLEKTERQTEKELLEMNLREVRKLAGKTQVQLSKAARWTQAEVSICEKRRDHLVSTLARFIKALGGEIEITARFGDRSVRLRGV